MCKSSWSSISLISRAKQTSDKKMIVWEVLDLGNSEMGKMWAGRTVVERWAPNLGMNLGIFLMGIWYLIGRFPSWEMTKCNWRFWGNNWQEAELTVKYFPPSILEEKVKSTMMSNKYRKYRCHCSLYKEGLQRDSEDRKGFVNQNLLGNNIVSKGQREGLYPHFWTKEWTLLKTAFFAICNGHKEMTLYKYTLHMGCRI